MSRISSEPLMFVQITSYVQGEVYSGQKIHKKFINSSCYIMLLHFKKHFCGVIQIVDIKGFGLATVWFDHKMIFDISLSIIFSH